MDIKKIILACIVCIFLINLASADLLTELKAYYKFDTGTGNTAVDALGGFNLTNPSGAWRLGQFINNSIHATDSGTNYWSVSNSQAYTKMSVIGWVNTTDNSATVFDTNCDGSSACGTLNLMYIGSNVLQCSFRLSNGTQVGVAGVSHVNKGTWVQVGCVYNGTSMIAYVNGTQDGIKNFPYNYGTLYANTKFNFDANGGGANPLEAGVDEFGIWNRSITRIELQVLYNNGAGLTYPFPQLVTLNLPIDTGGSATEPITFNATLNPSSSNLTNATIFIWNATGDLFNSTTNTLSGNITISTTWDISNFALQDYTWNVLGCSLITCDWAIANFSFTPAIITLSDSPDPIGEGQIGTYSVEINKTDIQLGTLNGTLVLNNTVYPYESLALGTDTILFSTTVPIPVGWGSVSGNLVNWYYNLSINGTEYITSITNQTIVSVSIDNCSTFTDIILNMSLYDEGTQTLINGTLGSSIELDLTLTQPNNTGFSVQYSNTWTDVNNALVCMPTGLLSTNSYQIDLVAEYVSTDHVTEFYYLDNGTLNSSNSFNSLTNRTISLFDLLTTDSTTFLFSFLDEDNLEVPNAIVHTYRYYIGEGTPKEVERSKQDDNGETHLHLVEEDVIYYFVISNEGEVLYTSSTYNAKCLATPCQIELEANPAFVDFPTDWDLMPNGAYTITSDYATRNIYLTFTSGTSVTMNLTVAKQDYNGDVTIVGSSKTTATSASISVNAPASAGNVTYYAIIYRNGGYIGNQIVDFSDQTDYFSTTGQSMGFLMLIAIILMGVSEGALFFGFLVFALIVVSALALFKLGYYALIGFICAIAILLYKAAKRGRKG